MSGKQIGPCQYLARDHKDAIPYAWEAMRTYGAGTLLATQIKTKIWERVVELDANVRDDVPVAGGSGLQTFVPIGPALDLFDQASMKEIVYTWH